MRLCGHTVIRFLMLSAVLLIAISPCQAQEVVASRENDRAMTGEPIFSHGMYYTGMVNYEGEMIPSFLFADYYVFADLVFKNKAQAKKYYKIANNIKKVYPIACEIRKTVDKTIAHMDSLPTKKEVVIIDRQCDMTGYELIKKYMGGFKAGFYNAFASLFGASLKKEYDPEVDDRLTERAILLIESGQM